MYGTHTYTQQASTLSKRARCWRGQGINWEGMTRCGGSRRAAGWLVAKKEVDGVDSVPDVCREWGVMAIITGLLSFFKRQFITEVFN